MNEFWNEKMKRLFYLYGKAIVRYQLIALLVSDIDKDGSITPLDFEILAEKLSALVGQGDGDRREQYANARKLLCQEIMRADVNQDGKVTLGNLLLVHGSTNSSDVSLCRRMAGFPPTSGD